MCAPAAFTRSAVSSSCRRDSTEELEPLVLEPLERVGRGPRLEGAATEDVRARGLHALGGLEQLQARLHRAGARHHHDGLAADRHVADAHLARLVTDLAARELVRLQD